MRAGTDSEQKYDKLSNTTTKLKNYWEGLLNDSRLIAYYWATVYSNVLENAIQISSISISFNPL